MSFSFNSNNNKDDGQNKRQREDDDYLSMDLEVLEKEYIVQSNANKKHEKDPYYIKRKKDLEAQRKRGYNKSAKELAKENQSVALNTPISSSNKGFQLLQKMGFKPGSGLGRGQTGITEPINLNKHEGSQGLGLEAQKREKTSMILEAVKKIEQKKQINFEEITRQRFRDRQMRKDLSKARLVCEQLDHSKGLHNNELWLPYSKTTEYKESSENQNERRLDPIEFQLPADVEKDLLEITEYLRKKHYYCLWCGTAYSSFDDLTSHCPGDTNEDH